jgi:hypothetical protein
MKIDRYTKVILTIIAACLVILVAREIELIPRAQAGDQVMKVEIVDIRNTNFWDPISVKIKP